MRLDTIEVLPFAAKLQEGKTCGGGRHRFTPLSRFLEGLRPGGTTAFHKVVREFLNDYPQRGLVIVISDFLDEAGCDKALQYLADYGNELMLIQSGQTRTARRRGQANVTWWRPRAAPGCISIWMRKRVRDTPKSSTNSLLPSALWR